ncbi:MAG: hypothetical protein J6L05_02465 [Ruminococcus sp.]|nr:hypothetical protein [Ruminococcus sp.]
MKKKDLVFIIGLTIFMGVLWIVGELVMGLWIAVVPKAHLFWLIGIVSATLIISVWHSMLEDESDLQDPKRQKYERKKNKRKQKKRR